MLSHVPDADGLAAPLTRLLLKSSVPVLLKLCCCALFRVHLHPMLHHGVVLKVPLSTAPSMALVRQVPIRFLVSWAVLRLPACLAACLANGTVTSSYLETGESHGNRGVTFGLQAGSHTYFTLLVLLDLGFALLARVIALLVLSSCQCILSHLLSEPLVVAWVLLSLLEHLNKK